MWIYMIVLTVLNLIMVYKNKITVSKTIGIISLIYYAVSSWHYIVNVFVMINSGIVDISVLFWDIFIIALLISVCFSVFTNHRKASLFLLWVIVVVMIVANWNKWFVYIIYLKSLFN